LTARVRQRIRDFTRVLACRFPTVQDARTKNWGKTILRNMARWRYASRRYAHPWELAAASRAIGLSDPKEESL
jgi:anaerobic magnesium-protoporphyrin IX monomethyl ester cyclase